MTPTVGLRACRRASRAAAPVNGSTPLLITGQPEVEEVAGVDAVAAAGGSMAHSSRRFPGAPRVAADDAARDGGARVAAVVAGRRVSVYAERERPSGRGPRACRSGGRAPTSRRSGAKPKMPVDGPVSVRTISTSPVVLSVTRTDSVCAVTGLLFWS